MGISINCNVNHRSLNVLKFFEISPKSEPFEANCCCKVLFVEVFSHFYAPIGAPSL